MKSLKDKKPMYRHSLTSVHSAVRSPVLVLIVMLNLVVLLLCAPVLASSLELADLPRSNVIEQIAKCRATCVETFIVDAMEERQQDKWDQTCRDNRDCHMCWVFCAMFEHNDMPDNAVCNDDFYCFQGCQVACQYQDTKNQASDALSRDVTSLSKITQDGSVVRWSPLSFGVFIYTLFLKEDGQWIYLDQTCGKSMEVPKNIGSTEVAVLASNKDSLVAMNSFYFQSPPPVTQVNPVVYPIRKVKGPMRGPLRPRIRVKTFGEVEYVSIEDLKKLLKLDEDEITNRKARSLTFFNWDLRVTKMRKIHDDLVEMELCWNRYPETGGEYWVRISSAPDVFRQDNTATILVPRKHQLKLQVEYMKHRMIARSPVLDIDPLVESVQEDPANDSSVVFAIGIVAGYLLFVMLIMALLFFCWTRTVREFQKQSNEESPKNYMMEVSKMESAGTSNFEPHGRSPVLPGAKVDERLRKFSVQLTPISKDSVFKFPPDGSMY